MGVVRIWDMRMHVAYRAVATPVAMRAGRHWNMKVVVVHVVVAVRVFVLRRVVLMLVPVRLHQMQHHACKHEHAACRHGPAKRLVPQTHGQCRSDEWSEGKYRTSACGTEGSLCQEIETQAQAVTGCTHGE